MLEHADRDDPVERPLDVAIVDQLELDPVRHPRRLGPLPSDRQLLLRQGDPEHVDVRDAVQIQSQAAPAAAEIEHPLARLQQQLRGDMRLLVELGLLDAVRRIGEVGAAVLHVRVEEEPVEVVADVVMMDDVALRAGLPVQHLQAMTELAALLQEAAAAVPLLPAQVAADQPDQVDDLALLEDDPVVHPGFGRAERRIARDLEGDPGVPDPDRDRIQLGIGGAVMVGRSGRIDDGQLAPDDELGQHLVENPHGRAP